MSFSSLIFILISLLITGWCNKVKAQFYYTDIWNTQQLNKDMEILKKQNIRTVSVKSFEDNGEPSPGFFCEKKIDKNYFMAQTITRSNITDQSLLTSYFSTKGSILKTTDSTAVSLNRTEYNYDINDRIIEVKTFTRADDDAGGIEEIRTYTYNADGKPEKMDRKKNSTKFSSVNFKTDEKGNVIEEEEILAKGERTKYFYYYDSKNRLTDVVKYNEQADRLLPDYMFEYNSRGQMTQMITTEVGNNNYYIWKYTYNYQELRETERCLSKERRVLGSIQYIYK